jgi:hypothetical protein
MRETIGSDLSRPQADARFLQRLRALIGREGEYLGRRCRLIEVLADEGALVLETREHLPPIQVDQYGQASYRANDLMQVPLYGASRDHFSDELLDLFASLTTAGDTNGTV